MRVLLLGARPGIHPDDGGLIDLRAQWIMAPESTEAIDALLAELRDRGVWVLREPAVCDYGGYVWCEVPIEDVDGRVICFGQEMP